MTQMTLADACFDFVHGYRKRSERRGALLMEFRDAIRWYSKEPWDYPRETLAELEEAVAAATTAKTETEAIYAWQELLIRAEAFRAMADCPIWPETTWADVRVPSMELHRLDEPAWAKELRAALWELIHKPGMTVELLVQSIVPTMEDAAKVAAAHAKAAALARVGTESRFEYDANGRLKTIRLTDLRTQTHVADIEVES